jgi:hypothetical protein
LRKFILIAACFTTSASLINNKPDVEHFEFSPLHIEALPAVELIEMEGLTILPSDSFDGESDLFDDGDNINRDEMNRFYDEIWPSTSPLPSR